MMARTALFCLVAAVVALGCESTPTRQPTFETDVATLFRRSCVQCHGVEEVENDLDLRTYDALLEGGTSGDVIIAGSPDESLLFELVRDEHMPPDEPLSARQQNMLKRWIEAGAPR